MIQFAPEPSGAFSLLRCYSHCLLGCQSVSHDNVCAGDPLLFVQSEAAIYAGIYVGDGRFVHAPATGGEVRLDRLNSKYWSSQQVAFRRP